MLTVNSLDLMRPKLEFLLALYLLKQFGTKFPWQHLLHKMLRRLWKVIQQLCAGDLICNWSWEKAYLARRTGNFVMPWRRVRLLSYIPTGDTRKWWQTIFCCWYSAAFSPLTWHCHFRIVETTHCLLSYEKCWWLFPIFSMPLSSPPVV